MKRSPVTFEDRRRGGQRQATQRLGELSQIARDLHANGQIAPHWPISKFDQIEHTATAILSDPPADLISIALDAIRVVRLLLGVEAAPFANAFEEVSNRPQWRLPYLCYLIPFLLTVADEHLGKQLELKAALSPV